MQKPLSRRQPPLPNPQYPARELEIFLKSAIYKAWKVSRKPGAIQATESVPDLLKVLEVGEWAGWPFDTYLLSLALVGW